MAHRKWTLTAVCMLAATIVGIAPGGLDAKKIAPDLPDARLPRYSNEFYNQGQYKNPENTYPQNQSLPRFANQNYPSPGSAPMPPYSPTEYPDFSSYSYNQGYRPQRYYEYDMNTFMPTYPIPIEDSRTGDDPCGVVHPNCTCPDSPYRTYDGTCNNIEYGSRGSAGSLLSRVAPARYDDYGKVIVETESGRLPLARVVSETIFKDKNRPDSINARSVMEWGQLVAHDGSFITERLSSNGEHIQCCTDMGQMIPPEELSDDCIPIRIPYDDPYYSRFYRGCMNMVRSQTLPQDDCDEDEDIQQISIVTEFLDLSMVYGSSYEQNLKLRTFNRGQLKMKELYGPYGGRPRTFLPNVDDPMEECGSSSYNDICYLAGDPRVNQTPFIAAIHTVYVREHNRLCMGLHDLHPYWTDDMLHQEARRIVIAEWQFITYNYWLPRIIGKIIMEELDLYLPEEGFSNVYDPEVNPSTMNVFTAGAFRFQHSTIPGRIDLDGEGRCPLKRLWLSDYYFKPGMVEKGDNFDSLLRGSTTQKSQEADRYFTKQITKYLFKNGRPFGDDLESFDIQRGRDHGIPSYNDMRVQCGLPKAVDFYDLLDVMDEKDVYMLKNTYGTVNNVDLFVGGMLEKPGVSGDEGAICGPTFGCIIGEQFRRWRYGDRYFFDESGQAGSFSLDQVNAIKKVSFSSILCENLDYLKYIQWDAFRLIYPGNELVDCKYIPRLDLKAWEEYQPSTPDCYEPSTGPNTYY